MENEPKNNDEQAQLWNGTAGQGWVAAQDVLDRMFRPFADILTAAVRPGDRVLDIGCGTGDTSLAAAAAAGASGHCLGVDISAPMIARARERAAEEGARVAFDVGDAQTHDFGPARFDLVISRFGVMFFADPVAAFANLRRAAAPEARLCVIAWRDPAENPFMTAAERAAAPLLPELPARAANMPGQFGFADSVRTQGILEQAGWRDIAIRPLDRDCVIPGAALEQYIERMGPVARFLREADDEKRAQLTAAIRAGFAPYREEGGRDGDAVRFTAACWLIEARA
jgi:SAM-dependent methyltransferase